MTFTRSELEVLYKSEEDLKVKERILFILRGRRRRRRTPTAWRKRILVREHRGVSK